MLERRNNFNFIRLILAIAVVYSHAYGLLGLQEPTLFGSTLGNRAVHGFFALSGFLIALSYLRSNSVISFFLNRTLRIAPALIVALYLGGILADYCDGFKGNIVPHIVNGPIWTLTWEVVCCTLVIVLGVFGILNRSSFPPLWLGLIILFFVGFESSSTAYTVISPMIIMFLTGVLLALISERDTRSKLFLVSVISLALIISPTLFQSVFNAIDENLLFLWGPKIPVELYYYWVYLIFFPLFIIFLGRESKYIIPVNVDISYGIYIYSWPAAQVIVYVFSMNDISLTPIPFFLLTMLLVTPLALLSWYLIEKPALTLKSLGKYIEKKAII